MKVLTLALLHAAQQERKAALLDAAEVGKLLQQWEGPFPVAAVACQNTYTLTLPALFKCSPTVNVDLLKPYFLPWPGQGRRGSMLCSRQWHEVSDFVARFARFTSQKTH